MLLLSFSHLLYTGLSLFTALFYLFVCSFFLTCSLLFSSLSFLLSSFLTFFLSCLVTGSCLQTWCRPQTKVLLHLSHRRLSPSGSLSDDAQSFGTLSKIFFAWMYFLLLCESSSSCSSHFLDPGESFPRLLKTTCSPSVT